MSLKKIQVKIINLNFAIEPTHNILLWIIKNITRKDNISQRILYDAILLKLSRYTGYTDNYKHC